MALDDGSRADCNEVSSGNGHRLLVQAPVVGGATAHNGWQLELGAGP
jgi:hypothetical protein